MLDSEGLQYGKPKKDDPRKTPAPKKDQKKGSKKNPKKSAENPSNKITFSKEVTDQLKKLVSEHNAKDKGSKVTLGMLKAVYRRGAGAFSTSHHPKMSRHGWAIARVNAFLYLMRNGRPSNPNYKQDNDLLPKSHPRSSKAIEMPIPKRKKDEQKSDFMSRCMSDPKMGEYEYKQRIAICMGAASEAELCDECDQAESEWEAEKVTRNNMIIPNDSDYLLREDYNYDEDEEEVDLEMEMEPEDSGEEGGMVKSQLKKMMNQSYQLYNMIKNSDEVPAWVQDSLSKADAHLQSAFDYMMYSDKSKSAEYQGKKVTLNKPFRTPKGPKKFAVYTRNESGNVVIVRFGDPNMEIKRDDPDRRRNFRARHNCDNPGPKYKARYWSCKMWESKKSVTDYTG